MERPRAGQRGVVQGGAGWGSGSPVWGRGARGGQLSPSSLRPSTSSPQPLREWKPGTPSGPIYPLPHLRDRLSAGEAGHVAGREVSGACSAPAAGLAAGWRGRPLHTVPRRPGWEREEPATRRLAWPPGWAGGQRSQALTPALPWAPSSGSVRGREGKEPLCFPQPSPRPYPSWRHGAWGC